MNLPKYCLDTHALVWYFKQNSTLSKRARSVLDEVFAKEAICFVPTMVLLEAFHISFKDKDFKFTEFLDYLKAENIIIVSFDKSILKKCLRLPENLNIHDRIIAATALATNSTLVTKDRVLRLLPKPNTVW